MVTKCFRILNCFAFEFYQMRLANVERKPEKLKAATARQGTGNHSNRQTVRRAEKKLIHNMYQHHTAYI